MAGKIDHFATQRLSVPFLKGILHHVRDSVAERSVVIFHSRSPQEAHWTLATVAARLTHHKLPVIGPDQSLTAVAMLESAMRAKCTVVLAGELKTPEDAQAARTAASLGVRVVAYVLGDGANAFSAAVASLGPWQSVNLVRLDRSTLSQS